MKLRVGELAKATGISVRTLHHYDEIGLLRPSLRTDAGHRLYTGPDVERLQRILSLKQLGVALDEIAALLVAPDFSPIALIERHIAALDQRIAEQQKLRKRLGAIADRLRDDGDVSTAEFLETIEEIRMIDKYFTPEQKKQLDERARAIGAERIREVEREWPELIASVRAEMDKGTDPKSDTVRELARRWMALVREFSGADPAIEASVGRMYQAEPSAQQRMGLDAEVMRYVAQACEPD